MCDDRLACSSVNYFICALRYAHRRPLIGDVSFALFVGSDAGLEFWGLQGLLEDSIDSVDSICLSAFC